MAKKKVTDPIKEFSVFGIGLGVILGVIGILVITQLDASLPAIAGFQRGVALGSPLLIVGCIMIGGGILVAKKRRAGVDIIVAAAFLLLVADLGMELGLLGKLFAFKLISILIYALPIILLVKAGAAKAAIADLGGVKRPAAAQAAERT